MKHSKYSTIIFDCDGVIFDTNSLKISAFKKALNAFPDDMVNPFIEYVKANFGKTRMHFFQHFLDNFAPQSPPSTYEKLLESYGASCRSLYRKASLTQGFLDYAILHHSKSELFVVSGNNGDELQEAFAYRKIDHFFSHIYGAPQSKKAGLTTILSSRERNSAVMIGDALMDYEAAKHHHIDFIFIAEYSMYKAQMLQLQKQVGFTTIQTLEELLV